MDKCIHISFLVRRARFLHQPWSVVQRLKSTKNRKDGDTTESASNKPVDSESVKDAQKQLHSKNTVEYTTSSTESSSSSSDESSDDEMVRKLEAPKVKQNMEAVQKLNSLLQSMAKEQPKTAITNNVELARPMQRRKLKKDEEKPKEPPPPKEIQEAVGPELLTATKQVAESIGGDVKTTESELLQKLTSQTIAAEEDDKADLEQETTEPTVDLRDLLTQMKVDTSKPDSEVPSRAQQVRQILGARKDYKGVKSVTDELLGQQIRRPQPRASMGRIDLFGAKPLGIFTTKDPQEKREQPEVPVLKTWKRLREREMKMSVTHPPANIFEEMILWTEQGKLWKFPINNEQGLEEEAKVGFHEHVFLERHLQPWCPKLGPIRHFMELVCVGLSKNPYFTADEKKQHIAWFKDYFDKKKDILKEVGALEK